MVVAIVDGRGADFPHRVVHEKFRWVDADVGRGLAQGVVFKSRFSVQVAHESASRVVVEAHDGVQPVVHGIGAHVPVEPVAVVHHFLHVGLGEERVVGRGERQARIFIPAAVVIERRGAAFKVEPMGVIVQSSIEIQRLVER